MTISVSIYLSVYLSIYLSLSRSIYQYIYIYMDMDMYTYTHVNRLFVPFSLFPIQVVEAVTAAASPMETMRWTRRSQNSMTTTSEQNKREPK